MMLLEWPVGAKSRGAPHSTNTNCRPPSSLAPPSSLVLVLLLLLLGPCSDSGVIRILQGVSSSSLPCHDWKNQLIRDGDQFIPNKNEPCRVCLCEDGVHTSCNMNACSPPACYRLEEVKNTCCEFRCLEAGLDNIHHNKTGDKNAIGNVKRRSDDIADQGLRLAASTVTSFLVLALLLFMVHRLCQRRHWIQMRRLNAPRNHHDDDNDNNPFSQDAFSIGMPCPPPYDCPPPPYTPPKPFTYIQPCEAPPPYEEVQNQMASNNPAFSGSLSPTSRVTDPSDCNSVQEPGSVSSMPGLGLGGMAPDNQISSIDMEDNSSIHETTPKTPFGADEGQFAHSPTNTRPFSTFFGSCTVNENSNGNGGVVRNSCGSVAARAERIRSCLFPSGKDHQDGVALGLTSQQAMAALSLRETGEETLPSKTEMFAPWYIKRSESIEIRRESRSPRNSYCFRNNYAPSDSSESESESEMPDMSSSWLKGSSKHTSMGLTATSPQSHTHPAGSNLSSFGPNNSRVANTQSSDCCNNRDPRRTSENSGNSFANGGMKPSKADGHKQATPGRPVRIGYVDSCKSSLNNNNNTPTATTPTGAPTRCQSGSPDNNGREHSETSGISKFDSANQLANSSFVQGREFGMNPSTLRIRNSLPPLELKALQPETRKFETLTRSSAITPPSALALSIVAGASAGGLLSVEHADDSHSERNFWNFHHPANLLNGRLQSPGTPVSSGSSPSRISIGMLQDRSNSLTSDISLFSICSETGEKKRTKEVSSSCNSTSTIATTPTATTPTDICNSINNINNNNNNRNTNNLNNSNNGGGPPVKNDVPYPDLFQANSNSSNSSNGGSGGVGGTIGGGAGGGGTHSSNQVAADANQMPLPRRETMTTATLVSNILKRYSDVPRQSMEHDENSYCKPSSSSTSSSSSSSSNTVSLVTNQQQQQQQQHQQQRQQQHQQPQANHVNTQNQQQPQAHHLHTQSQQQQPQTQHLHTQSQQQQQHSQQHLNQKQEQHHNNNNNNSHNNHHHNKTSSSSSSNNNTSHHNNNNSSHYYHHHHHRSNRNTDSGPASTPLIGNSGANTGGGGGGGAMGGDCAFAQPYPRKSEIRTLDHRSRNPKSIDDVIRTIDITPVLQSIVKPLDNTARDGSSREDGGGSKSRFSALECGAGKHFLSSGFPFGDKPPPPPPPPLPMFPKPKSNPADRKKRHSVAANGGNVSKQSKTKSSSASKAVAGKFQDDVGNSTSGMKLNSSGAALLENIKEPTGSAGSSSKSESSPNRGGKSRSGSNGSGNSSNSTHRTACEPCFKLYGYVDDPSVLYNCCHRMETDKEAERYKNAPIDKNTSSNISPAMMKYLTSSPKSSDTGHATYTAGDGAGSCVGGAPNPSGGNNSHSNTYRPKKQSQLRTSPEHKSKSGSSAAYKASAGAVSNYATLTSHSHPSQSANPQKKRHGRSKDKNRKSYPGASPEGAPRGAFAGASPEGAPRETKIVSNPWLTTSSSGASASSASPARRKFEKTHRSKHHNSVIMDMSRTYPDECQASQSGTGRHGNQGLNHVDQLSSYV